ncbi:transmembrane protein 25 [Eudromia elegans]
MGPRGPSPLAALALLLCAAGQQAQGAPRASPAPAPAAPLAGPGPALEGQPRALRKGEHGTFACQAPLPAAALAWSLDGRQLQPNSPPDPGIPGTFTLAAHRADHQLMCALTPATPGAANASVRLDVQFPPELLHTDTRPSRAAAPPLIVMLLALVPAGPPATITWLGPDGRAVTNASQLLAPNADGRLALPNRTVRLRLGALPGLSIANASVLRTGPEGPSAHTGLLDARVELPLLAVAAAVAVVLGALLGLGCLAAHRPTKPSTGPSGAASPALHPRCPSCSQMPREHRSLPPNLRLSDLVQEPRGNPTAAAEEPGRPELEKAPVLIGLGFIRLPTTGYIYKVSSTSSDEIWL